MNSKFSGILYAASDGVFAKNTFGTDLKFFMSYHILAYLELDAAASNAIVCYCNTTV